MAGIWHGFEMPTARAACELVKAALKIRDVRHGRSDGKVVQLDFYSLHLEEIVDVAISLGWSGNRLSWDGVFKRLGGQG